ncbi:MAG TPA: hypothetical protein VJR58_30720 [Vineibacter sp.]|nr:hypothetical protein [Vineibacter sp.]
MPVRRLAAIGIAAWVAVSVIPSGDAHACACCTDIGQRRVATDKLDTYRRGEIDRLRFAPTAELYTGSAGPEDLKGLRAATTDYGLEVRQQDDGIIFELRDKDQRAGTLSLVWPDVISIFEVDPRQDKRAGGLGPRLYKEWSVTGKITATGIFEPSNDGGTRITLILQGGGNSCTGAEDFTDWTLSVDGPNAAYSFIGALLPPR